MPPTPRDSYRSDELGDMSKAIDRATLGVGAALAQERLQAPSFRRILVAVDGSDGSRHNVAWAILLAKRFKAHVTVVSVAPSPEVARALRGNPWAWQAIGATFLESDDQAAKALQRAGMALKAAGLQPSLELAKGTAAASIVDLAVSDKSDLLILGSHGHGMGERLNLGSVGSTVKHHVPCSVLVVRGPPQVRGVLLATDGSQRSRLAVQAGLEVAQAFGARPTLAHVIDVSSYGLGRAKSIIQGKLLAVQERMRESPGSTGLRTRVAQGPPASRLRRLAKEEKASLIVVGSRGLGGLKSLTLGSVSDKLTHKADQSVLVVKPQPA